MVTSIINGILNVIHNSWLLILELVYSFILCGGTLLVTFYLFLGNKKALKFLVEAITIWLILEGVSL